MPIRVVVIDDDADFVWLTRLSLQLEHDITVIGEAQESETGVALALREQPDIVVVDLMMPRIDGFEAATRIKRSRPTVKVLTVTALSLDDTIRQKMYRSGIDAFLSKLDVATALAPMIRSLHEAGIERGYRPSDNDLTRSCARPRGYVEP
jgi:DNA-binding NarL/FixJ family response regulator